jgi:PAS domain S-box-containing protein
MTAKTKTKAQLVIELAALQQRVTELEVELRQREVELEHWLAAERENWALSEALNQTGAAIGSSLRGEEVLDHILEEMSRVVACDAACLLLIEEDIARVYRWRGYIRSDRATPGEIVSAALSITRIPILHIVHQTRRPQIISDPPADDAWVHKFGTIWVKSYACVPIRSRGRVVGFLTVDSETPGFFEPADAEPLQAFADQAAMALDNVGHYDQVRGEMVKRLKTLKKERNFITAVLDTADALVMALNRRGQIVHFNRACEQTSGYTFAEIKNRYLWELLPAETAPLAQNSFAELAHLPASTQFGQSPAKFEWNLITKTGQKRLIAWSNAALYDRSGEIEYIIATGIDITEQRQAEATLRAQNEQLQARNRELDAFAHTVAHDLKNPLGVLTPMAEIVAEDYDQIPPEKLGEYLKTIARTGRRASRIVEALLLLAGVRQKSVRVEPLDMSEIITESLQRLESMISEYQAEIITPDTWPVVRGYGPWVEEIWVNYLSNGLKSGGQPPHLELGATPQPDGMVRFWVRDNGPDLTPEARAQLFAEFTQLEPDRIEGHGLGLSIVRRIVEKLGGQAGVESEGKPGQGSIFSFTLPLANP